MLLNPFTPAEIAASPQDFFGRNQELRTLQRSLSQGSVVIQGPIGIGKSSLMARGLLMMEGFNNADGTAKSVTAVGNRDIKSVDEAARLVLEEFIEVDEKHSKVRFKLGSMLELESAEICRNFTEGRHLAVLQRILQREYLKDVLANRQLLLIAIDEADKCPVPIARLLRSIVTHTQHKMIRNIRFVLAGVSPFFQHMVEEDQGVSRFIYEVITLEPMEAEEAADLVETKLYAVVDAAEAGALFVEIEPTIIQRVVALSGGHPHILQLLGSHLVEHENDDPDGMIDSKDLLNSLRRICYADRVSVYEATIHKLQLYDKMDAVRSLMGLSAESPVGIVSRGFPTRIDREKARHCVDDTSIQWLVEHHILSARSTDYYGLLDEFLRIRLLLDEADSPGQIEEIESSMISAAAGRDDDNDDDDSGWDPDGEALE